MSASFAALLYVIAGALFIMALRGLSSPESARQGNRFGMVAKPKAKPPALRRVT